MSESVVYRVMYKEAPGVRAQFDQTLDAGIKKACANIDRAFEFMEKANATIINSTEAERLQKAHCLALVNKSLNDIIGSLEMLRLGYFDLAQGILRGVIEGLCTVILINADQNIFQQYRIGQYSVNTSVDRLARRGDLGLSRESLAQLKGIYQRFHRLTHPTIAAVSTQFIFEKIAYPIGGFFDPRKVKYYNHLLGDLAVMAENIGGFLYTNFNTGQPE